MKTSFTIIIDTKNFLSPKSPFHFECLPFIRHNNIILHVFGRELRKRKRKNFFRRIMENKRKTVEEFISKGERLMDDPKSPKENKNLFNRKYLYPFNNIVHVSLHINREGRKSHYTQLCCRYVNGE